MLAYTKEQFGVLKENYIKNDKFSFFASFCRDNLIYRIDKVLKVCQIKTKDGSRLREKAQLVIDIANELENYLNSLQDLGVEIPDFSELTDQIDDLLRKQIQGYLGAKSTKDRYKAVERAITERLDELKLPTLPLQEKSVVRVWYPGCGEGHGIDSIIRWAEKYHPQARIEVYAADISLLCVKIAQQRYQNQSVKIKCFRAEDLKKVKKFLDRKAVDVEVEIHPIVTLWNLMAVYTGYRMCAASFYSMDGVAARVLAPGGTRVRVTYTDRELRVSKATMDQLIAQPAPTYEEKRRDNFCAENLMIGPQEYSHAEIRSPCYFKPKK